MRCIRATRRPILVAPLLIGLSLACGCSTAVSTPAHSSSAMSAVPAAKAASRHDAILQAAVTRWNRCVARHINAVPSDPLGRTGRFARLIEQRSLAACEGYRRDIAQRFPRHLEARVHATLAASERTQGADGIESSVEAGALVEAFEAFFPGR